MGLTEQHFHAFLQHLFQAMKSAGEHPIPLYVQFIPLLFPLASLMHHRRISSTPSYLHTHAQAGPLSIARRRCGCCPFTLGRLSTGPNRRPVRPSRLSTALETCTCMRIQLLELIPFITQTKPSKYTQRHWATRTTTVLYTCLKRARVPLEKWELSPSPLSRCASPF